MAEAKKEAQTTPEGAIFLPKAVAELPKQAGGMRKGGQFVPAVEAFLAMKPTPKPGQWFQIAEQKDRNTFGASQTIRNIAVAHGVDNLKVSERKDGDLTKLFISYAMPEVEEG